jgi:hypothetical protein
MEYAGTTYTSAQAWEISIRGLLNMVTSEGETGLPAMDDRNKPWTFANAATFATAAVPAASANCIWGAHPWYEVETPVKYNGEDVKEVGIDFIVKACSWHVVRGLVKTAGNTSPLGKIGNFQEFGTSSSQLNLEGYSGLICPMRELLIAARIFKYILDNDINENVYDAIKDVKFSYDLYGSEQADIALDVNEMSFTYEGGEQKVNVTTKDQAWTATVEGEGITVSPMEGAAGATTEVTITASENTLGSRTATVTFTTATGKSKTVDVIQQAGPTSATIKEFMVEYVKLIDVWKKNVGTVNLVYGIGAHGDANDYEDAHYIPDETVIKVGDFEYSLADGYELAARSYLLLRGYDGTNTEIYGKNYPLPKIEEAYTVDSNIPETHNYKWGSNPYNESSGNGGMFKYTTDEGDLEVVKVDILDDLSNRATNYPIAKGTISNLCGYPQSYLPAAYSGAFCAKRQALAYAYFFKYMLDNNLQDAKSISPDQTFDAPLFYIAGAGAPTIKAFAQEYVKLIDVWENTTGLVNVMGPKGLVAEDFSYDGIPNIEGGHYIPLDTKLTIAGTEYSTSEIFDIALRSYLLLRGYDATDETKVGAGNFATLEKAYTMEENFLPARAITWGSAPFSETSGNGGYLKMGVSPDGVNLVKIDLLDNYAFRNCNFALQKNDGAIGNIAGYTGRSDISGYYGSAAPARMLLTYAYFFKYMLDNNLEDATQISADQTFTTALFGVE